MIILTFANLELVNIEHNFGSDCINIARLSLLCLSLSVIVNFNCLNEKFLNCLQYKPTKFTKIITYKKYKLTKEQIFLFQYIKIGIHNPFLCPSQAVLRY